ncbi:hypothetical protein [Pseudorhodoferax sp. Leaf267]|uniref:preprotein translocase subunit SecA n=1 Tax=Pseudorhodoferax sp. Leaf267 TaxID=1736316 RepID=UPI00138F012C|nr:hypothetical protein [Pseudorhodoferax sp. Leaf267]
MPSATLPVPGLRWGSYPERSEPVGGKRWRRSAPLVPLRPGALPRRAGAMWRQAAAWQALSDGAFSALLGSVQDALLASGFARAARDQACAYVAEAGRRTLGRQAYATQLMAALAILDGQLVEMATGEGKSLAAALAAGVGALAGIPVHVLTSNDYLVQRDAELFAPLYARLGLAVAFVIGSHKEPARRAAYAAPVVYVTAREAAFDYLRDRLSHGTARAPLQRRALALSAPAESRPVLRGLCMAVIDEADSVLVDEALMPLILSREVNDGAARAFLWQARALAGRLAQRHDFTITGTPRRIALTSAGRARLTRLATTLGPLWKNERHRDETVTLALTAQHLLQRDRDYVVQPADPATERPADIAIVDALTGRIADGRKWSRGLHALVALKEGLPHQKQTETLSQITFQRFFRRYHRLGGMSGTLYEARAELRALYGCAMVRVPLRLPSQASAWPTRVYADDAARRAAAVPRVAALVAAGRPVLIGCDSVESSLAMAEALQAAGIAHQVLNARQDAQEAAIVACAGRAAQVTVATNMAGRGTDIRLDAAAEAAGGLHVLSCQLNDSKRLDRQLAGRAARQGQPGSHEVWLALHTPGADSRLLAGLAVAARVLAPAPDASGRLALSPRLALAMLRLAQRLAERRQSGLRRQLFKQDLAMDASLSFNPSR